MKDRETLFEDVVSSFSSVKEILSRFELWKFGFSDSYKDSYMGLCIPKLLAPFIKLELLTWNPLEVRKLLFDCFDKFMVVVTVTFVRLLFLLCYTHFIIMYTPNFLSLTLISHFFHF